MPKFFPAICPSLKITGADEITGDNAGDEGVVVWTGVDEVGGAEADGFAGAPTGVADANEIRSLGHLP